MSERMAGNLSSSTPPAEKSERGMLWRVLGMLFGCICLTIGIRDFRRAYDSTSWPTVPGTIQQAEVDRHVDFDGPSYRADIAYAYNVAGREHIGNRVAYGDYGFILPGHARKIVARYPAGMQVTVHYQPDAPDLAVLEPGITWSTYLLPLSAILMLIFGLRRRRRLFESVLASDTEEEE